MLGEMFATTTVNIVLSVGVVLAIVALRWPNERPASVRSAELRLTAALLFVRFAIVVATLGTAFVNEHFLMQREEAAVDFLSPTRTKIESTTDGASAPGTPTDVEARPRHIRADPHAERRNLGSAGHAEQVVNLIVVYVIETLILPLGFLVVAWGLVKQTWRRLT